MNENIDLTKILRDCPTGWKFYSSIYGEVEFKTIKFEQLKPTYNHNMWIGLSSQIEEDPHPIKFIAQDVERSVSKAGEHIKGKGECTFFPSKEQRDWSKFTAPWYKKKKFNPKTLQPFDKVLVRENYPTENWYAAYFSHIEYDVSKYDVDVYEETPEFIICTTGTSGFCYGIPYNDETKHLVGTEEEAPEYYRYWED